MKKESLSQISGAFGISAGRLNLIAGGRISYVYEYVDDERPLILRLVQDEGDRYMLTRAETDFVAYLADHGVNAARPIASKAGDLTSLLEVEEGRFVAAAFERAPGNPVTIADWTPEVWEALGEQIGAIHRLTKEYTPPQGLRRPHWHQAGIMDIEKYIPGDNELLREKSYQLLRTLKDLPKDKDSYGLIHSDPGRGNIFIRGGTITLFDFEDCEYHWFVNDLAIALYFAVEESFVGPDIATYVREFMRALLRGYNRQNQLDEDWLDRLHLFHRLRDLLTVLYFYADGGNSLGEEEIAQAVRSRINVEFDRRYLPLDIRSLL